MESNNPSDNGPAAAADVVVGASQQESHTIMIPPAKVDDNVILILGSGIIGLSIGYHLAKMMRENQRKWMQIVNVLYLILF